MSRGDRGGHPESENPSYERATAILRREPMHFGDCANCDRDPQDAADDRSGEEPKRSRGAANDGADQSAHA